MTALLKCGEYDPVYLRPEVIAGVRVAFTEVAGPAYVGEVLSITGNVLAYGIAHHWPSSATDAGPAREAYAKALAEVCGWLGWEVPS